MLLRFSFSTEGESDVQYSPAGNVTGMHQFLVSTRDMTFEQSKASKIQNLHFAIGDLNIPHY
jgi:hypothetical protein